MKKHFLVGILGVLTLALLVVIFYLLWKFSSQAEVLPQFAIDSETNQSVIIDEKELTWQEELAQWPSRDFTPATEKFSLYFDADTSELKEKNKYFQLIISKYDVYSMFCLRQILNSFNVKYFLLKTEESPEIFLDTGNTGLIEDIVEELKKYKINTEVKEIWL